MNYCSQCGATITLIIPPDDNRLRYVCSSCRTVYYQNPKVVAGCIPEHEGKVLLCKRAIDPRMGCWTLPAGYMELAETSLEAAVRETFKLKFTEVPIKVIYTPYSICRM